VPGEELGSFSTYRGGIDGTAPQVFASDAERAMVALRRLQIRVLDTPGGYE
jgi:hypothetical protein